MDVYFKKNVFQLLQLMEEKLKSIGTNHCHVTIIFFIKYIASRWIKGRMNSWKEKTKFVCGDHYRTPQTGRISDPPSPNYYSECFIGPTDPSSFEGKAKRSECWGKRDPALLRDRYCLDLVTVVASLISMRPGNDKKQPQVLTVRLP